MDFTNQELSSQKLIDRGNLLNILGKIFSIIGIASFVLFLFICLIAYIGNGLNEGLLRVLSFHSSFIVSFLIIICYLGVLCGLISVPLYLISMQIWTMGKLVIHTNNMDSPTNKISETTEESMFSKSYSTKYTPYKTMPTTPRFNDWTCPNCLKKNIPSAKNCLTCGEKRPE